MLLLILLVAIFWVVIPGLLTGWMLREHGRSFAWGLLPGALLGPAGILAAAAFIYISGRGARGRRPSVNSRRFRPFYHVPFVGRLHVSTAWSLAGVVAFLCTWMVCGIGYEFYTARLRRAAVNGRGPAAKAEAVQAPSSSAAAIAPANQLQASPKTAAGASSGGSATPPGGPLLSGLAAQAAQAAQASGRAENSPAQTTSTLSNAPPGLGLGVTPPAEAPSSRPPVPEAPAPASERVRQPSTASAVSEVTRSLSSEGHRVHVAVSGDAQTATLSVSGPTLTRHAGNQLVGRARYTLREAGIRIVVMLNGRESWTYIL